jgi:hypothetical protein
MIRRNASALEPVVGGPNGMSATEVFDPCTPRPRGGGPSVPPSLERAIAARWKRWEPWVWMHLCEVRRSDPSVNPAMDSPDSRRLRLRHSGDVLNMMREGISMRTIRRHRLDDPRLTDELRAVLVQAAMERQGKAWYRRSEAQRNEDSLRRHMTLGPAAKSGSATGPDRGCAEALPQLRMVVLDPLAVPAAIQAIRQHVCQHFYMRERRDPELTVRTNRREYVIPRQIAMYIARQLTGASLQEIGREFGHRHHTTVLHCIRKIEKLRCSDDAVDRAITQVMNAVGLRVV